MWTLIAGGTTPAVAELLDEIVDACQQRGVSVRMVDRRPMGDRAGFLAYDLITTAGDLHEIYINPEHGPTLIAPPMAPTRRIP